MILNYGPEKLTFSLSDASQPTDSIYIQSEDRESESVSEKIIEFEKNIDKYGYKLIYSSYSDRSREGKLHVYSNKSLNKYFSSATYNPGKTNVYIKLSTGVIFTLPIGNSPMFSTSRSISGILIEKANRRSKNKEALIPAFFKEERYQSDTVNKIGVKKLRNNKYRKIKLKDLDQQEKFQLLSQLYSDLAEDKFVRLDKVYMYRKSDFFKIVNKIELVSSYYPSNEKLFRICCGNNQNEYMPCIKKEDFFRVIDELRDEDGFDEWRLLIMLNNPNINIE